MADFFTQLNQKHKAFILKQKIFFTATAPEEGKINLSPKGMDTFQVIDDTTVAYLDLTGSGNETAAHLLQNGRMTIMMCSFDKQPLIFRLYGTGSVINQYHANWNDWINKFTPLSGTRQIIVMNIESIQTSCGYAVPIAENMSERDTLIKWADNKGEQGIKDYWAEKNQTSLDGLDTKLLEK